MSKTPLQTQFIPVENLYIYSMFKVDPLNTL